MLVKTIYNNTVPVIAIVCAPPIVGVCCGLCNKKDKRRSKKVDGGGKYMVSQLQQLLRSALYTHCNTS